MAHPTPVARAAKDFPKLQFVISHGAWPSVMQMIEVAFMRENVFISPDLYINGIDRPDLRSTSRLPSSLCPTACFWVPLSEPTGSRKASLPSGSGACLENWKKKFYTAMSLGY